ncbi:MULTISPECIES: class I SAM-dependent methyltransferase [Actinoplanes]|uniref:class I SAM-dependent methyltransferase n=1 Tax=Actinoplanes TaxID=1865 RepID=UPI0005F2807D|nr:MULTISPECIES: class I SAM-dependent methyltransferase [Actinoplanes]
MPPSPPELQDSRRTAEWFGLEAERYDRARPRYPESLIDRIVAISPGTTIVDAGCGTGISSRAFQAAGCTVLGVEPDPRMAAFARGRGLDVEVARFEDWDPAGRTFDAVVSGTAWHWVDPFEGARKAAGLLSPTGVLALFENDFTLPPEIMAAQGNAYRRAVPDAPGETPRGDGDKKPFAKAAEGIRRTAAFGEPEPLRFAWERTYTRDEWLDILPTQGGLNHLAEDVRARFLAYLGAAIDEQGGAFVLRYTTVGITAIRR